MFTRVFIKKLIAFSFLPYYVFAACDNTTILDIPVHTALTQISG